MDVVPDGGVQDPKREVERSVAREAGEGWEVGDRVGIEARDNVHDAWLCVLLRWFGTPVG